MEQITVQDAGQVAGAGFSASGFVISWVINKTLGFVYDQVMTGNVDYAGVAESQGTYYNTVGA